MSPPLRRVAIVLHAHLPYVLEPEPGSLHEGWLLSALWECYLPLARMFDALLADGIAPRVTLSVSPPLASMLRDARLPARLRTHLDRLAQLNRPQLDHAELGEAARAVATRMDGAADADAAARLLDNWFAHHRRGALELMTTSVSHALLPALSPLPGAIRAQLALGQASFQALGGPSSPLVWLPECAVDDAVDAALAELGLTATVVDEHAVRFASPRPPPGSTIVSPRGVVYLPRDRRATHRVWSPTSGFPGYPSYREFHRDLGLERDPPISGLKYWRVTTRSSDRKAPYRPAEATARARHDAREMVHELAGSEPSSKVLAFDAELFGHWWFEGPEFLEQLLRAIDAHHGLEAVTLGDCLRGNHPLADPAPSSWGEGGFFDAWLGPSNAHHWRAIHRAHRRVSSAVRDAAVDSAWVAAAIRELMLLEASDWPFMLGGGRFTELARSRLAVQLQRVQDALRSAARKQTFLRELDDRDVVQSFAARGPERAV